MARVLLVDPESDAEPKRPRKTSWLPIMHSNGKAFRVDGRSRSGRLLRDTRDSLLEQLNRTPSPAEKLLIDRLAWLHLCTQLLDAKILSGTVEFGEAIQYSSQINTFSIGLSSLGLLGSSPTVEQ